MGLDRADRLAAVGGGGDDFDIVMRLQAQLQALGRQRLVVDEDGADGHECSFLVGFERNFDDNAEAPHVRSVWSESHVPAP